MIKLNREELYDKINACWIGKNIGGTIGAPYEGKRELLNVTGFVTEAGKPLPNDDLDLQLVWLKALYERGPKNINSKVLGEYWLTYIGPCWNEYGICKANMQDGFLPPMSGSVLNEDWKHSNGAWIRTEVWACCFPAMPETAMRMAFEDASVDHGFGEGTYAAIFVAAMESVAFVNNNINELLEIGLSKIPEGCRVSCSVRLVMDCFEKGMDWKDARNAVVEDSKDLGWFQAPANVAFVVLGLLYGGCDFKKSMLYAVNCGDDTDCTAATVGSILGIMYGNEGIPDDWRRHIGDDIKTVCIRQEAQSFPASCSDLTELVKRILPVTLNSERRFRLTQSKSRPSADLWVSITDEPTSTGNFDINSWKGCEFAESLAKRSPYSITTECVYAEAMVELDSEPSIKPLGTISGKITVKHDDKSNDQMHLNVKWFLPEGFTVDCPKNLLMNFRTGKSQTSECRFTITAGETIGADNDIVIQIKCPHRPTPMFLPVHIMG